MHVVKAPQSEPIPGYRLVEPLGRGGFGEVWKCEAPGGLFKAIKFISGGDVLDDPQGVSAKRELRALQLMKAIRHPYLLSIERIEIVGGEVLIVMELADRSLHDVLREYRSLGRPGIPRAELLGYLREAAEAIDVLNQEHGLQHLDIKPRNLFVVCRHVKVADFGLVSSLSELQGQSSWLRRSETLTPLYAPPETFLGCFTLFSDQYSLAISYQELLTGTLPFTGRSYRQLALRHVQEPPDLQSIPEAERPILVRALAKEPRERFPSCGAFVQALVALGEVAAPRPARMQGTHADLDLGELAATPTGSRPVRIVSPPAAPPAENRPVREAHGFLAGYQLLECVQRHAAAETWKTKTLDGNRWLIKLINGHELDPERVGRDPLDRLRELRHPGVPDYTMQTDENGRLALITEMPDGSLADRLRECQQIGHAGIPRVELLAYLRQAAEALDDLQARFHLQHLCLTPRQLVLRSGKLYLLDFGLMELLWLPASQEPASLNTRYAAPELFDRQISPRADQYSLALIYQELLTGIHAFRNYNLRQMALARQRGRPDLGMLPATDRPLLMQALDVDPERRFPSCTAFIDALEAVEEGCGLGGSARGTRLQLATVAVPSARPTAERSRPRPCLWDRPAAEMKQILAELVAVAAGDEELRIGNDVRYRIGRRQSGDRELTLVHSAYGRLLPATVPLKLSGFEQEWNAQRLQSTADSVSANGERCVAGWTYRIGVATSLWQRCIGRTPALLVQIELALPGANSEGITDARIRISTVDCRGEQGKAILDNLGPRVLRSLRNHLQLPVDRRREERWAWVMDVEVRPLYSPDELGDPVATRTRDLSRDGLGLELPCRPPCPFLAVQMNPPHRAPLTVPLHVLYELPLTGGHHHVGGRFAWELVPDNAV